MGQRTLGIDLHPARVQRVHQGPRSPGAPVKWAQANGVSCTTGLVYHHILVGYLTRFYLVDCKSSCSLKIMTLHHKFRAPAICSNPPNHQRAHLLPGIPDSHLPLGSHHIEHRNVPTAPAGKRRNRSSEGGKLVFYQDSTNKNVGFYQPVLSHQKQVTRDCSPVFGKQFP